jgi:NADPH:quinone reductase-like Zn-dependent oxidoreductase
MKQTQTIPETFLGVGYTRDRAGLPLEAVRVPVPRPAADEVLIRVAASSLNPLEYKLADLNFMGRTPPVVLGLDLSGVVAAAGHDVRDMAVGDAVAAMADLNGDGGWVATGGSGGEGGYAVARQFLTVRKPPSLSFRDAAAFPMCFLSAFAALYGAVQAGDTVYIPGGGAASGISPCRWRRVSWRPGWSSAAAARPSRSHWPGSPARITYSTTSATTSRRKSRS